ncbi:MAG: neutral/alkaline non-lysosomal ceramidase N-terminal domain-containing protein [Chloroflexi bacterium]|nr:neutral/alkaline non-lysosomal ceramidase N-terminal domain-containing protein [Chloroflexota bacterium]
MNPKNSSLQAGVARRIISPPPGIFLVGYGDRTQGNRGVHDELTATALVCEYGETAVALVALDMLCINEYVVGRIRQALEPEIQPVLCCSHTHSGPIGYAGEASPAADRKYYAFLEAQIVQAVRQAYQERAPARLALAQATGGIAINRREHTPDGKVIIGQNPEGALDSSVNVLSVLREDGERLATLVNYACHGTVLGPDNLLASADWIGVMRRTVEAELGGLALFLQGATGDLNPKMGWRQAEVWQLVQEQGEQVGRAAIQAAHGPQEWLAGAPVSLLRRELPLPFETPAAGDKPPTDYRKRILAMAGLPGLLWPLTDFLLNRRYPWRSRLLRDAPGHLGYWATLLNINALRIGELALVTFGSETFTEIGLQVKAESPARRTLFASVTDGCIGYLTTAAAHAEGGYEVDTAPYAYRYPGRLQAGCAALAQAEAQQMLAGLYPLPEEMVAA